MLSHLLASFLGLRSPRSVRVAAAGLAGLAVVTVLLAVVAGFSAGLTGALAALVLGAVVVALLVLVRLGQLVVRQQQDRLAVQEELATLRRQVAGLRRTARATDKRLRVLDKTATRRDLRLSGEKVLDQVQALQLLSSRLALPPTLPPLGRFTASADFLGVIADLLVRERPTTVVESGSGVSTLVLALAARQYDVPTRIVALEHHEGYAAKTRLLLEDHGVADIAEVRLAPLADPGLPGHGTDWYDRRALDDLTDVGLVVVDGPPKATGPDVRYPMLPLLADRLAPRCLVVADDTRRPEDEAIVRRWLADAPDFELVDLELEKGALMLRRPPRA